MQSETLRKLDAGLMSLVSEGGLDETGQVPIFIRATGAGDVDKVLEALAAAGGQVRHVMNRFSAVSAWVPLRLVKEFADKSFVDALEMPQEIEVA